MGNNSVSIIQSMNFQNFRAAVRIVESEIHRIPAVLKEISASEIMDMRTQVG